MDVLIFAVIGTDNVIGFVVFVGASAPLSLWLQTIPKVLESHGKFIAVVQDDVSNNCRIDGEEPAVEKGVGGAHVWSRVICILCFVVHTAVVNGSRHVVEFAKVIIDTVGVDWEISSVPSVGVPDSKNKETGEEHATNCVESRERRHHERVSCEANDIPVKSRNRVEKLHLAWVS